jgi:putative chitinase
MKIGSAKTSNDHSRVVPVTLTCACNRDVTTEEMMAIYTSQSEEKINQFLPYLNKTCEQYSINSCLRKAHFFAQIGHESGQLEFLEEMGVDEETEEKAYGGYKGRGLIQITLKNNYKAYGDYVHHDFLDDKKTDLEQIEWATDSAGWFWNIKMIDLNLFADNNDFIYITRSINGGFNGYKDRKKYLQKAQKVFFVDFCPNLDNCLNMEDFYLHKSKVFNQKLGCFAWGFWHDPLSKKKGTNKSENESIRGYMRFSELLTDVDRKNAEANKKQGTKDGNFSFKFLEDMITFADKRVSEMLGFKK